MKKIKVTVRKEKGVYWANTENIEGIVVADGHSFEEMKKNLQEAFESHLKVCEEDGDIDFVKKYKNGVEFVYQIDLNGELGRRLSISPVMMRKYATGKTKASEKRLKEIEQGIHLIGKELQQISLL